MGAMGRGYTGDMEGGEGNRKQEVEIAVGAVKGNGGERVGMIGEE